MDRDWFPGATLNLTGDRALRQRLGELADPEDDIPKVRAFQDLNHYTSDLNILAAIADVETELKRLRESEKR